MLARWRFYRYWRQRSVLLLHVRLCGCRQIEGREDECAKRSTGEERARRLIDPNHKLPQSRYSAGAGGLTALKRGLAGWADPSTRIVYGQY
jgi:hypothetical protein